MLLYLCFKQKNTDINVNEFHGSKRFSLIALYNSVFVTVIKLLFKTCDYLNLRKRYEKIMVTIGAQRRKIYEKYRDDIQFQFDVVLIEGTDFLIITLQFF